jgi:hypothetical protein
METRTLVFAWGFPSRLQGGEFHPVPNTLNAQIMTLDYDSLVTVPGGLNAVLMAPLSVRKQTDHPKFARRRYTKCYVSRCFDEPHGPSDTLPLWIHSVTVP